ncbi:MAG: PAS domain S-box protein, partial [Gammaproteobacteria bacterium]|nr:PAS domain S-box protein [Gammaproteobacteria bacterium]
MSKDPDKTGPSGPLREQAQAWLGTIPDDASILNNLSTGEIRNLIHELRVHQIELEMQNEELRLAQEALGESRVRYQELYDYAPMGYLTVGATGLIEQANLTAADMFGIERVKLKRQPLCHFVIAENQDALYMYRKRLLLDGEGSQTFELGMRGSGGKTFHALIKMVPDEETDGGIDGYRIAITDISECKGVEEMLQKAHDELEMRVENRTAELTRAIEELHIEITERQRAEEAREASESRATALLKAIPDLMFRQDSQGVFLDYRANKADLYAQSVDTIIGKRIRDLVPPEFADLVEEQIRHTLDSGEMQTFEYQLPIPERGLTDYEARMVKSGADEVTTIVRDITERKRSAETIEHQAAFDALTDLPNRRLLLGRVVQALARCRRHGHLGAALFIDLDNFKNIND